MISPSASTRRESTAPQTVGRNAKISHDREVIKVPIMIAWNAGIRFVSALTATVSKITVSHL